MFNTFGMHIHIQLFLWNNYIPCIGTVGFEDICVGISFLESCNAKTIYSNTPLDQFTCRAKLWQMMFLDRQLCFHSEGYSKRTNTPQNECTEERDGNKDVG